MSDDNLAVVCKLPKNTAYHSGLSLSVTSHKSNLFATVDGEINSFEYCVCAKALLDIVADNRVVSASCGRGKLQSQAACILLVNLNGNHLFELLDAALYLHGFCRLVTETLNEFLYVGNLLLLVLVCAYLLFATFLAVLHELVIRQLVVVYSSARNLNCPVCYCVQECAVVTYKQHRVATACKELLEPLDTLNVEVVGRLVEQQYVRVLQQQFGKLYAHAPSAAELACGAFEVFASESETLQGAFNLCLIVAATHHCILFVEMSVVLYKFVVALALVVGALCKFVVHLFEPCLHFVYMCESEFCLFIYSASVNVMHHLWQVTDCKLFWF